MSTTNRSGMICSLTLLILLSWCIVAPIASAQSNPPSAGSSVAHPEAHATSVAHNQSFHSCTLTVPVTYLPEFRRYETEKGPGRRVVHEGKQMMDLQTTDVALVLVDTWNSSDPAPGKPASPYARNLALLVAKAREHGIPIIHAPNHPVVDKYPQYHAIKAETLEYIKSNPRRPDLKWPPMDNTYLQWTNTIRRRGRASGADTPVVKVGEPDPWDNFTTPVVTTCQGVGIDYTAQVEAMMRDHESGNTKDSTTTSGQELDISRFLRPLDGEYVVATHDEFRYVLWKNQIQVLLYAGGSVNECLLQRETGLNMLVGTDFPKRTAFTVIVLEDCATSIASPKYDAETFQSVMLEYLKFKLAFVSNLSWLGFTRKN